MKKFIIACTAVIIAVTCWMFVSDRIGSTLSFNMNKEVKTFTTVSDKEILVDTGNGMEPFEIRGVDMGVGIPGHFATDYAIDKETYLRWFRMIKDMGANCVRVYTLLQDDFYDAVWEFNHDNPDPLYIIHGVWIDDYVLYSHRDAYSKDFLNEFLKDSRILVDMIHGNKRFSLGEDLGSGSYTKDISPWVLGYILGVEWEDTTVAFTDHMQEERDSYEGKYMRTTEEATPFETMLAQVGDKIIEYETEKYSSQRLIAFSNWPTTDPLEWNQTVEWYFRKFEQVDVEHIKTTDEFLSGQFASYHIYPYFPDYLGFMDVLGMKIESREKFTDEDGTFNSYRAYLTAINAHHTMPVIISEYGVPSSRGRAQSDRNTGRSQGGMSEEEQGKALVQCYKDIMASGCAGSVAFTWQDEWFKRTWNTMAYTDLTKTCYWSDYQTNEQYFGILSFDPGEVESVCYVDGDVSEWEETDIVMETDTMSLSCKYDEKYVYFRVHKDDFHFGNPHCQRVNTGRHRHQQQFLQIQSFVGKFFLFLAILMQGVPHHLPADEQQQHKGDPVVIPGDVLRKSAAQQPAQKGHQRLESTKEQCDDKGMPVVDAPHSQALAYRHRKSVHRKADPNEQNFYCTHAFTPCQSKNKVTR